MSSLKNLTTDDSIADETDRIGGGGVLDSGLYLTDITLAYVGKSQGGAQSLNLAGKTSDGRDLKSTLWMTSGDAKGNANFYTDKNGAKNYLPGFLLAQSLALLTVGKELADLDTEIKVVSLYDYDAKAEVPTKVEMITELLGKQILVGVIKQVVDKNVKTDKGYVPSGDTREENEIDKFFRASDRMTTAEIRAKAETAAFADAWSEKNTGKVRNKAKGAAAGGTAGAPAKAAASTKPKSSLFA